MNSKYICKRKTRSEFLFLVLCQFSFYCWIAEGAPQSSTEGAPQSSTEGAPESKFCSNPIPSENPVDLKWLHEHFEDGWYAQFGNAIARNRISQFTKGVRNVNKNNEENYSELCARLKLDYTDNHISGIYSGNGGKEALINCTSGSSLDCNVTDSENIPVGSLKVHFSYFDKGNSDNNHNVISIVQCLPNGETAWTVFTVTKTISDEEIKTITEHLKSIGMNPEEMVPMHLPSCPS